MQRTVTKWACAGFWSLLAVFGSATRVAAADDFESFVKPLFAQRCAKCHGGDEINAEINLKELATARQLLGKPRLIEQVTEVILANDMPPEGEPQLDEPTRNRLVGTLKQLLRQATADVGDERRLPIRRLNRFQYNNTVRDLFRLDRDVFALPEKLMTRQSNYLAGTPEKMPDKVNVQSLALHPKPGMRAVRSFPKDLRAAHGYDNQANQLTLSPLLLDAFLRLSVSIIESPDFNEQTVGIWHDFFKEPDENADRAEQVKVRLKRFLRHAFRGPVESETVDRYAAYAAAKMKEGLSFTEAMKKVASATLSSPLFLYRSPANDEQDVGIELASKLSYFLWASCPDDELLQLAESGQLGKPEVLNRTIDRMFADPRIERFLDTFPSQWMQLENILAATPDPKKYKLYSLEKTRPAGLQMVLEPLLLFDATFIEDRPIVDLIAPSFGYRSDFLKTWYTSDLKPPKIDVAKIVAENARNDKRRKELQDSIKADRGELDTMLGAVRKRLLAEKKKDAGDQEPVDLKPYAAWEFNGDLKESIRSLDLKPHGKPRFEDGMVVLDRSYLLSKPLPIDLKAKSLEVWLKLHNLDQAGGGAMGIQGPGDFFDTIVIGERKSRHWISGSNGFSRTEDFPGSTPEQQPGQMLHLVMVYATNGTTTLYRNGAAYGKPFRKGAATFPKNRTSVIFGLRHLPPGGNKFLTISIDRARLYDRALTADEVAASSGAVYVTDKELAAALSPEQTARRETLVKQLAESEAKLKQVPPTRDPRKLQQNAQRDYENRIRNQLRSPVFQRVAATDPRYGGVITNAAMLSMTSGSKRTHPIARGAWIIEVIFNDPPPPPPNDVPPLNEKQTAANLTIREKFAQHRENPDCAGCHSRLDPLGFALENFDITGRWRDKYENGREVDATGRMMRKHDFTGIVQFKAALVREKQRFARSFTRHLLRFALARELQPSDSLVVDGIVDTTEGDGFRLKSLIRETVKQGLAKR